MYGSLYPFDFHGASASRTLWDALNTWPAKLDRFEIRDIAINIFIYVPVGLFGSLWVKDTRLRRVAGISALSVGLLLSLATPALFVSAVGGQNGALTAALLCGGLVLLDRQPVVAGLLFGCLVYKPHLAAILPFALIAGRRWLTFATTGTTAVALLAASVALFGTQCWLDYLHNLGILRAVALEDGTGVWHRAMSMFVFARRLGTDVQTAYAVQAVFGKQVFGLIENLFHRVGALLGLGHAGSRLDLIWH